MPEHGTAELSLLAPGGEAQREHRLLALPAGEHRVDVALRKGWESRALEYRALVRSQRFEPGGTIGGLGRGEEQFTHPQSVAIGSQDKLYVVDTGNDRIEVLSDRHTYLFEFGGFTLDPSGRLSETESQRFDEPADIVQSINRDLYITDRNNNRVVRLDRDGRFLSSFGADTGLRLPRGIASNSLGEVLVADTDNDRVQVFDRDGRVLRQIGTYGWGIRQFRNPFDVTVDSQNRVYVADTLNDRIQVFDQFGKLLKIHKGGFTYPIGVRADDDGFVWVADGRGHQVVRIAPCGRIACRLARPAFDLSEPTDIVEASTGDLYVVDRQESRLVVVRSQVTETRLEGKVPPPARR